MKAFLGGILLGGIAVGVGSLFFDFSEPQNPFQLHYKAGAANWYDAVQPLGRESSSLTPHYNARLGSDKMADPEDYDIDKDGHITLVEEIPLLSFGPDDLASICLHPILPSNTGHIEEIEARFFFSDTTRARIQTAVMERDGKDMAFMNGNGALSTFPASAQVAESFTLNTKKREELGDLSFAIKPEAFATGLRFVHIAAGDDTPITHCYGRDLETDIHGYKTFKASLSEHMRYYREKKRSQTTPNDQ